MTLSQEEDRYAMVCLDNRTPLNSKGVGHREPDRHVKTRKSFLKAYPVIIPFLCQKSRDREHIH